MQGLFISYRRIDSQADCGRICDRLIAEFGKRHVFRDVDSIPIGADFRSHLGTVLGQCRCALIIVGPRWLDAQGDAGQRRLDDVDDFVRIEIETALARDIPVIPVLVGNATMPGERQLPASLAPLAYRQAVAVRPDPDFHRDMDRLIAAVRAPAGPPTAAARRAWMWPSAAACVVALAGGSAWWSSRSASEAPGNPLVGARFTRLTDFPGSENDAAISRDGRFVAFRSDRDGPVDTWVSQIGSGRFVNLTGGTRSNVLIRNMGFTPDSTEVWLSGIIGGDRLRTIPLLGGTPRPFLPEHAINVAWAPDGSQLVYHLYDDGDQMFVADGIGANPRQIFTLGPGGHNHFPIWSRDGQWIYFASGSWERREMDIWRIRPTGGSPERMTNQGTDIRYLSVLDNQTLLYVSPDEDGAGPWLWALDTAGKTSRRISSGLEVYSSVDASQDGRRLVASVSNPTANLWSVPILDHPAGDKDVTPVNVSSARAYAPRFGGSALFYLSSHGGGDGLWRFENGQATEIWRGSEGALLEPAAVAADGRHVAVILRKQGKRTLHVLSSDGADLRPLALSLDVTGAASWSPDGVWIAAGGVDANGPGLFRIPAGGGEPVRLVTGTADNPVWSPDGTVIVYTGPVVGVLGSLLVVRPDGTPVEAPAIKVRVGTEHYRFVPGRQELVYVPTVSQVAPENFWLMDLVTKKTRQLATIDSRLTRTFDITPDGTRIVFDRLQEPSDIVLIDLAGKP